MSRRFTSKSRQSKKLLIERLNALEEGYRVIMNELKQERLDNAFLRSKIQELETAVLSPNLA